MDGEKIRKILAQNIKHLREHRLWSQADLAANSDISVPFLSEIERGNKWPFPDTLGRISKALNVQIHELFRDDYLTDGERDYTVMVVNELLTAQKAAADNIYRKYLG
ncbi:MAG: helix-turn-helix domain-containing protein [Treponema sp.]|nr:helix-turn-helix domain-containing protein [Treponema sp.]